MSDMGGLGGWRHATVDFVFISFGDIVMGGSSDYAGGPLVNPALSLAGRSAEPDPGRLLIALTGRPGFRHLDQLTLGFTAETGHPYQ